MSRCPSRQYYTEYYQYGPSSGRDKRSAISLRTFRGAALPGGVFVTKTAVGHRAEARRHEKFSSWMRTLHESRSAIWEYVYGTGLPNRDRNG